MDFNELKQKYTEVVSKRAETSKTFDKGGGQYTLAASLTPIHYKDDNDDFREIDLNIVDGGIEKNIYKTTLLTNEIGYSFVLRKDNSRIDVKLKSIGQKLINYSTPIIEGNRAIWEDIDTDVDFIIEFRAQRVRCWKKLKSATAVKDITFTVIEDDNDKGINVVDKIVGSDASGKPTIQTDVKTKEVKSVTKVTKKNVKTYDITQIFSDKVVVRDPQTRVKSESIDVTYPVMIDADVQVSVNASADDGYDGKTTSTTTFTDFKFFYLSIYNNSLYINNYFNNGTAWDIYKIWESFTRFDGITIPQSVTIDDATLNLYLQGTRDIKIYAFDENDPNAPTAAGDIIDKTAGIASNTVATTLTGTAGYGLQSVDVKDIVQELVNSYDYSNEAMMFFYRAATQDTSGGNTLFFYAYDWGTTKAPELVINYTTSVFLHYTKDGTAVVDITLYDSTAADLDTWVVHHNNSDWEIFASGTWDSGNSEWDSVNAGGMYDILNINELGTWIEGYRPTKMRITFTGATDMFVYMQDDDNNMNVEEGSIGVYTYQSGEELDITYFDSTSNLYFINFITANGDTFSVTNIEFYEGWHSALRVRVDGETLYAQLDSNLSHTYASDLRVRQNGVTYAVLTEEGTPS